MQTYSLKNPGVRPLGIGEVIRKILICDFVQVNVRDVRPLYTL